MILPGGRGTTARHSHPTIIVVAPCCVCDRVHIPKGQATANAVDIELLKAQLESSKALHHHVQANMLCQCTHCKSTRIWV